MPQKNRATNGAQFVAPHLTAPITPPIIPAMRMPGEYTLPDLEIRCDIRKS